MLHCLCRADQGHLASMARKALMVNSSYMRRVWTVMEAVVATDLHIFPLKGFSRSESRLRQFIPVLCCSCIFANAT